MPNSIIIKNQVWIFESHTVKIFVVQVMVEIWWEILNLAREKEGEELEFGMMKESKSHES